MTKFLVRVALCAGLMLGAIGSVQAQTPQSDRLEGYYYPKVTSRETYVSRARVMDDSDRARRLGFVSGLTQQLSDLPYAPSYAIFAKGEEGQRMIIVAYGEGRYNTIYRARALFAAMTGLARLTPLFRELQVEELFTFFDLVKMMGFSSITISDGAKFTHQVMLK